MDKRSQLELAYLLATLRREGRRQSGLDPRLVPPEKATAYRIAQTVAEELGWEIAGWKIAATNGEMQKALSTDSTIYGRVFAECRFIHDAAFPPLPAILADGAGASTIIYGPPIEDWRTRDVAGQEAVLLCNGKVRRKGTAAAAVNHPMVSVAWLANELSRTGIGLKAGQMISTGTLTGMLAPKPGETYVAAFGPFGSVTLEFDR